MIKFKYTAGLLLPAVIFLLSGCIEKELDFDSIKTQNWNAEWAIPLINSQLNLDDLVRDSSGIIHEGDDGLILLIFENQDMITFDASDLGFIPDHQKILTENFIIPDIMPGESVEVPVVFLTTIETDEPGVRLDSCIMKAGSYEIILRTDLNRDDAFVDITIPNLLSTSTLIPLHFVSDISNPGGEEITRDTLIDMNGYTLVFDEAIGPTNHLVINAVVHATGDSNSNNSPYFLKLENYFTDMDYDKCFGYFGQQVITMKDTIMLNMFSINEQGNFTFGPGSINLRINVSNSFGIPVMLDVVDFTAYHYGPTTDSVDVYLFGEGFPSTFDIDYPSLNELGQSVMTEINTENSNINEAVEISAGEMNITVDGHLNPSGDSTINNFAIDTSNVKAEFAVEVGLFGSVSGFKVVDTVDFSIGSIDDIYSLLIVLDAQNWYPLTVALQLDFVDSVYQIVHTLLPPGEIILEAAPVGDPPEYRVTEPTSKLTDIVMVHDEILKLKEVRKILITGLLSTTDNDLVKIYMDYFIHMKIGVKVGINY